MYIAAVGYSQDRQTAERNAFANLSAFFGQSIQADQTIRDSYYEAARSGAMTVWLDNIEIESVIRTSTFMDTLIGAEIREIWFDDKNKIYYAAAVMERQRTIRLYANMITANLEMIKNLTAMNQNERNTFEGFSRYQFAGTTADINTAYANLLNVLGAPVPDGVRNGGEYRMEALNIARAIPVSIIVTGDREGRIAGAFSGILTDYGFRTGVNNSRYLLRVNVRLSGLEYPANPYQFVQMELNANLTDTYTSEILLPYNLEIREGHATTALAENRVFLSAEQKIASEYKEAFTAFFSKMLP